MIVPDLNLLIYAANTSSPFHEASRRWLEEILSGTETVGLVWNVLIGFLRIEGVQRIV